VQEGRKIDDYCPNRGQDPFHKSTAKIRVVLGGNQSGKSVAGGIEAIWYALGIHPYKKIRVPNKGRIIASLGFEEGAGQVIVPILKEWLPDGVLSRSPKLNQAHIPAEWNFSNGSVINILSGEQDKKVFEGWTGHWSWMDEPGKKDIFEATRRGLMRMQGDFWTTMTPLEEPWFYNDLYVPWSNGERPEVECFSIDIWDNCVESGGFLTREAIESYLKDCDEETRATREHGVFRHLSGRIYPQFDKKVHVVPSFDVPRDWPIWDGFDPHLQKPHAYCQWAIDPGSDDVYVCNEIYSKMTIPELAEAVHQMRKGKRIICTLIDSSAETPDAMHRVSVRRMLEKLGIRTRLADKYGNVEHGISGMRARLAPRSNALGEKRPTFFVMDHCTRHITEFMNYVQDNRNTEYLIKDKPRKTYDDMMDLDRYFIVENPTADINFKPVRYARRSYNGGFEEENSFRHRSFASY